jgi:hypothetical protein
MISPSAQAGKFVISLCTVAVPIAIPQPRSPQLMRYRFFLHTCWEEGARCHRLYMGYFETREAAQKWLGTLRRIYPSAFVSVSPEAQALTGSQVISLLDQPASFSRPAHGFPTTDSAVSTAPQRRPQLRGSEPSLQDTVEALKVSALDADNTEDSSSTGVRHLRIEIQQEEPRPRAAKRAGSRKP